MLTMWRNLDLLKLLVAKDYRVRYRGSVLGYMWTFFQPLISMGVYVFVVGTVFNVPYKNYPLMLLVGILVWNFFYSSLMNAQRSIVDNAGLVKGTVFPREMLPVSQVLFQTMQFFVSFLVLLPFIPWLGGEISLGLLQWVPFLLMLLMLTLGMAMIVSCVSVYLPDLGQVMGLLLFAMFFCSPVLYDLATVHSSLQDKSPWMYQLYLLNPLATILEFFRNAVVPSTMLPPVGAVWMTVSVSVAVFFFGQWLFLRLQRNFVKAL